MKKITKSIIGAAAAVAVAGSLVVVATATASEPEMMFTAETVAQTQECVSQINNAAIIVEYQPIPNELNEVQESCDKASALMDYDAGTEIGDTPANNAQVLIGQEVMFLSFANVGAYTNEQDTTRWAPGGEGSAALDEVMNIVTTTEAS